MRWGIRARPDGMSPPLDLDLVLVLVALLVGNLALRVLVVALSPPPRRRDDGGDGKKTSRKRSLKTLIVLGSGGHTAEMFAILRSLDARRYAPRAYVLAATDTTSAVKVERFENEVAEDLFSTHPNFTEEELTLWTRHTVTAIPRSREVGQNYAHSVFTTLYALIFGVATALAQRPDVVLCNGPGTCIPLCAAAFAMRVVAPVFPRWAGGASPVVVYVESIARVASLSLSGKLLYHLRMADAVYVQWEGLRAKYPRAIYAGRIM